MMRSLAFVIGLAVSVASSAQPAAPTTSAEIVSFQHTLRRVGEFNFPNYFQVPEVREAVYRDLEQDLKLRLGVTGVVCPGKVEYEVILFELSVGSPREEFPEKVSPCDFTVGIFSFITKQTKGPTVSWSVKVVVKKHGKTNLKGESRHELEYFDAAGPPAGQAWMGPGEFARICNGLIMEALGLVASSTDKVIVGWPETEEGASALPPQTTGVAVGESAPAAPGYALGLGVLVATGLGSMSTDLNGHPGFGLTIQGYVPLGSRFQLRPAFEWTGYRVNEYNLASRILAELLGAEYWETRLVFRTYRLGLDGVIYFRGRYRGPYLSGGVGVQLSRVYLEDVAWYGADMEELTTVDAGSTDTGLWLGGGAGYQWEVGNVELRLSRAPYSYTSQRPPDTEPDTLPFEGQPGWALHLILGLRF